MGGTVPCPSHPQDALLLRLLEDPGLVPCRQRAQSGPGAGPSSSIPGLVKGIKLWLELSGVEAAVWANTVLFYV